MKEAVEYSTEEKEVFEGTSSRKRREILESAIEQVCGHRVEDYGKPEDSFQRIGMLWSAYLFNDTNGYNFSPKDVAVMMALMKIARIKTDVKSDSYVDLAGYAACAGEIGIMERKGNSNN